MRRVFVLKGCRKNFRVIYEMNSNTMEIYSSVYEDHTLDIKALSYAKSLYGRAVYYIESERIVRGLRGFIGSVCVAGNVDEYRTKYKDIDEWKELVDSGILDNKIKSTSKKFKLVYQMLKSDEYSGVF